jgi:sulfur relay (sulfurtransferase) complex TusBCD TusD component (DsrE family)
MRVAFHVCVILALLIGSTATPLFAGGNDPLFINLTTDDPHRADMAITFGRNQQDLGHPLSIFLNDKGVAIGSKANASKFKDHQAKLQEVISRGGAVLICPMCMKHYGVKENELVPGLKVGSPDVTGAALFKDNTKTLTW